MGITVIFSSHILNETSQVADHIGIISDGFLGYSGRINKDDNLEEIFLNVVKAGKREVAAC